MNQAARSLLRLASDYGMLLVLVLLGVIFSIITLKRQEPTGAEAARAMVKQVVAALPDSAKGQVLAGEGRTGENAKARVLIAASTQPGDAAFATTLKMLLEEQVEPKLNISVTVAQGPPTAARQALETLAAEDPAQVGPLAVICRSASTSTWGLFDSLSTEFPGLAGAEQLFPPSYWWPDFLKPDNLVNIADQNAVIAILAIGMTLVIITGGIDLSVGSLLALSAVVTGWCIERMGGESAGFLAMMAAVFAGVLITSVMGLYNGVLITRFSIPPFIATLSLMLIGRGLAYDWTGGESVHRLPDSFGWLGRASGPLNIPVSIYLMLILYGVTHLAMTRTTLGRYIYAVGGNAQAAELSGISVKRVKLIVYILCGATAGLGGVLMTSQLVSGAPTYGQMYELSVIAAVVVGGASITGGSGRIFGTLIGSLIIAVIQNGMNLLNISSFRQMIVLGLVIQGAVLLDQAKRRYLRVE